VVTVRVARRAGVAVISVLVARALPVRATGAWQAAALGKVAQLPLGVLDQKSTPRGRAVLAFCGARHLTGLGTVDGNTAQETQLVKAFSTGGLQYPDQVAPKPPPPLDGVADAGAALERWAKQQANVQPPAWKLRVDLGAKAACPT